jgi:hypothetical protein
MESFLGCDVLPAMRAVHIKHREDDCLLHAITSQSIAASRARPTSHHHSSHKKKEPAHGRLFSLLAEAWISRG